MEAIRAFLVLRGRAESEPEIQRARVELADLARERDQKEAVDLGNGNLQYRAGRPHGRIRLIVIEEGDKDGEPVLINVLGSNDGMRPGSPIRGRRS